jgi:hypothetical protein
MGRLCIAWTFLESVSEIALRGILGEEEYARSKTSRLDMGKRWEMILEHAPKKHSGEDLRQLQKINEIISVVTRDRNIIVHGLVHAKISLPSDVRPPPGSTLGGAGEALSFARSPAWTIFRGKEAGKSFPISTNAVEIVRINIQSLSKKITIFNSKHNYTAKDGSDLIESDWPKSLD